MELILSSIMWIAVTMIALAIVYSCLWGKWRKDEEGCRAKVQRLAIRVSGASALVFLLCLLLRSSIPVYRPQPDTRGFGNISEAKRCKAFVAEYAMDPSASLVFDSIGLKIELIEAWTDTLLHYNDRLSLKFRQSKEYPWIASHCIGVRLADPEMAGDSPYWRGHFPDIELILNRKTILTEDTIPLTVSFFKSFAEYLDDSPCSSHRVNLLKINY